MHHVSSKINRKQLKSSAFIYHKKINNRILVLIEAGHDEIFV